SDGVHFILLTGSADVGIHPTAGGAMPLSDFVDRDTDFVYDDGGTSRTMQWDWDGYITGAWGPIILKPEAERNEFYDEDVLVDFAPSGPAGLFVRTMITLQVEGIEFHWPLTHASLLSAVGNEDLHDSLVARWLAHAPGAFVVGIGGLPAPL